MILFNWSEDGGLSIFLYKQRNENGTEFVF